MSQTAFPLDDTPYLAQDLRLWHIGRTTGIINATGTDFTVTPVDGINVNVSPGFAYIRDAVGSYGGLVYGSTENVELTGQIADTNDRYDYVAVRYTKASNKVELKYVVGTTTKPSPVRTEQIWEIIVAIVHVRASSESILTTDITDTRMASKYCGLCVDTLTKIPTDSYAKQLQDFITSNETTFTDWFATIKDKLDGDTATKLANQITTLQDKVTALEPYKAQVDTLNAWKQAVLAGETTVMIFEEES